jgi:radical SAM protein with 4Fe4S-binding SPASM domain
MVRFIPLDDWAGQLELPEKFGKPRTEKTKDHRYPCDLLWTAIYISAEGNVLYCCHDYKKTSNLPSIMDKHLSDIWCEDVSREREKHINNNYESEPCARCTAWQTRPERY